MADIFGISPMGILKYGSMALFSYFFIKGIHVFFSVKATSTCIAKNGNTPEELWTNVTFSMTRWSCVTNLHREFHSLWFRMSALCLKRLKNALVCPQLYMA